MTEFNPIGMFNAKRTVTHTVKFKALDKTGEERKIKASFQTHNMWEEMTANTVLKMVNQKLIENGCEPLTWTNQKERRKNDTARDGEHYYKA